MSKEFSIDTIDCFISGDWGADSYSKDTPIKVNCIRGADINNINNNDVMSIPTRYISKRSLSNKTLSVGDIVVEKSGGSPTQSTGRVAYISEHVATSSDTVCSNFCTAFRVKDKWDSKYIYYYLKYIYDLGVFFNFEGKTSGIKNLDLERAYKSIPIKYIPKEKQQKVVKILALLDKKIELNNKIISEFEQMAKELYNYWFVQFDFPDTNGKPYRSSGGKMTYNPTLKREIPEGWDVNKLFNLAKTASGGTPTSTNSEYYDGGNIPWVNSGDINNAYIVKVNNCITQSGLDNSSAKIFPAYSVLVALYGATAGKVALLTFEACTNQAVCSVMPLEKFHLIYIRYYLSSLYNRFITVSTGSARDNISQDTIRYVDVIIPINNIINKFNDILLSNEKHIVDCLIQNQKLEELRDWLLPMLMNGQVTVQTDTKEETKKETPIINLSQQRNQRFELWLSNQGAAARGEIDKATLREIFNAMDEDDK